MDEIGENDAGPFEPAWKALEAGDVATARKLAETIGGDDPEGLLLRAACFREEGDYDDAEELLRQAIAADNEWASPELWLAEILAADPDRADEAVRHAARALDLADEEGEFLSALALKAGLEMERGDEEAVRATLADLPPPEVPLGDPDAALEVADLYLALGDVEAARARLQTLTVAHPDLADAWHALGIAAAELDDEDQMRAAWKRTWALDAAPGADQRAAGSFEETEVVAAAQAALEELPQRARELLRGVPIVVADLPAEADVDAGLDPRVVGLFSGTPYPEQSHLGGQPGLTQILLFRKNLERIAENEDTLREEVRTTMLHEAGHFFGLDDADLEEAGLG